MVFGVTERDGSFRRLIQTVKNQSHTTGPGRPRKDRVSTTGWLVLPLHERMKTLARARSRYSETTISVSDIYNEAARVFVTDLHSLLGDEMRLPTGAISLTGILGLRELIKRPMVTPLNVLPLEGDTQRTTLHFDQPVWDALMDTSLIISLQMRRVLHVHRMIEVSAAWYLTSFDMPPEDAEE